MVASLLTTIASQHGNAYFRFVARVRNPGPHRPATVMTGATFPATRLSMDDPAAQGPGWKFSGSGSRSSTASSSSRDGGRSGTAPTGGR
jgi:hypothetical protein